MGICKNITFAEKFEWTPRYLFSMIIEIDKYCPEVGMPNTQIALDPHAQDMTNISE
jgi:hypothetical protein